MAINFYIVGDIKTINVYSNNLKELSSDYLEESNDDTNSLLCFNNVEKKLIIGERYCIKKDCNDDNIKKFFEKCVNINIKNKIKDFSPYMEMGNVFLNKTDLLILVKINNKFFIKYATIEKYVIKNYHIFAEICNNNNNCIINAKMKFFSNNKEVIDINLEFLDNENVFTFTNLDNPPLKYKGLLPKTLDECFYKGLIKNLELLK